jgi:hypothetical protein
MKDCILSVIDKRMRTELLWNNIVRRTQFLGENPVPMPLLHQQRSIVFLPLATYLINGFNGIKINKLTRTILIIKNCRIHSYD